MASGLGHASGCVYDFNLRSTLTKFTTVPLLCVLLACSMWGCGASLDSDLVQGDASSDGTLDTSLDSSPSETKGSAGCHRDPLHGLGGVQVSFDAGAAGDGQREFFLTLPSDYDPSKLHGLIVGYPGTDWVGEQVRPYLDLERHSPGNDIFVYPDPLRREFKGWGTFGGWLLGPHASPANGSADLVFTEALIDYLAENYCVDTTRVFATGHSWGGDMAMVVSCFLGNRFAASVPVAANRPYWFEETNGTRTQCEGQTAVWTMFGQADDHFSWQVYPGQFGDECVDFWVAERDCDGKDSFTDLDIGAPGECVAYTGCSASTRFCLYGPGTGHQRPDYFPVETMKYFSSF